MKRKVKCGSRPELSFVPLRKAGIKETRIIVRTTANSGLLSWSQLNTQLAYQISPRQQISQEECLASLRT